MPQNMQNTQHLDALLDRAAEIISTGRGRMAGLARHVGVQWSQCHEWVVQKKYKPSGEYSLRILEWVICHEDGTSQKVQLQDNTLHTIDGRKLEKLEADLWLELQAARQLLSTHAVCRS